MKTLELRARAGTPSVYDPYNDGRDCGNGLYRWKVNFYASRSRRLDERHLIRIELTRGGYRPELIKQGWRKFGFVCRILWFAVEVHASHTDAVR